MRILTIAAMTWVQMVRRKDVYVLFVLAAALLFTLLSIDVFGLTRQREYIATYVTDVGLLLVWVSTWILAVVTAARQLPEEERNRTIFPLLAKPLSRAELVVGKWLGAWGAVSAATVILFAMTTVVVVAYGGRLDVRTVIQALFLHLAALGVVAALALAFSTRANHDTAAALALVASGASFGLLPRLSNLLAYEHGVRSVALTVVYHLLPHFEVFDMRRRLVHRWGPAAAPAVWLVLAYGAALISLFLSLAWVAYRRKRFSRGVLR